MKIQCAKCSKMIDQDSTYCIYCGETVINDLERKLARKVIREQLSYLIGSAKRYGIEKEFFSE